MQALQTTMFDYTELDTETRIVVQQRASEIKALMKRTASDIVEIGQKLIEVKGRLDHGQFIGWFTSELGLERTMAARFIQVAERFGSSDMLQIATFAPSALYLLAAPSTPDAARDEAITRAEAGEDITHSLARDIVNDHKGTPETNRAPASMPFVPTAEDYKDFYGDEEPELWETDQPGVAVVQPPAYAPISDRPDYDGDEWKTPPQWISAARAFLGAIDLDPATNSAAQQVVQADLYFTKDDNGLGREWVGSSGTPTRVWCNPPYSTALIKAFAQKAIEEYDAGRMIEGLLLVNNCTDTGWFFDLAERFPMMFSRGRVKFW